MHILFGLLILAILGVAAIGAREVLLPLLIKFITTALIAIILIWLTTALLPWSLIVWLIAAVAIAARKPGTHTPPQLPTQQFPPTQNHH